MIFGIKVEAGFFLYAGLSGITVLFAYNVLSLLRRFIPHSQIAVGAEDLLFWIVASVYLFDRMYETTYGSIRWFFLLGMACGAMAGWALLRFTVKIYTKLKKALEKYRKSR